MSAAHHDALDALPADLRGLVADVVHALAEIPGIVAIALGGSRARGVARPDSDIDLGLYYFDAAPPEISAVRAIAERFAVDGAPVVTDLYEWGPWVNGGAWIHTRGGKVDFLYRSVDHVRRVIAAAARGELEWHAGQQPPYGFHSVIYLAETHVCVPLHDPDAILGTLKRSLATYPPALKAATVRNFLWLTEFTVFQGKSFAARGDVYNTVGCLTRALSLLTQVLFALNEVYFITDKGALETIETFAARPDGYRDAVHGLLAAPGSTAAELNVSMQRLASLFARVSALAPDLYEPKYRL